MSLEDIILFGRVCVWGTGGTSYTRDWTILPAQGEWNDRHYINVVDLETRLCSYIAAYTQRLNQGLSPQFQYYTASFWPCCHIFIQNIGRSQSHLNTLHSVFYINSTIGRTFCMRIIYYMTIQVFKKSWGGRAGGGGRVGHGEGWLGFFRAAWRLGQAGWHSWEEGSEARKRKNL